MPGFGTTSKIRLAGLDIDLQAVLLEAIKYYDFSIIWGHRGEDAQNAAYAKGASKLKWPNSKHNGKPSLATDLAPYPLLYDAHPLDFAVMAGVVLYVAWKLEIKIRWGGDWNKNMTVNDENFKDLGHFELVR